MKLHLFTNYFNFKKKNYKLPIIFFSLIFSLFIFEISVRIFENTLKTERVVKCSKFDTGQGYFDKNRELDMLFVYSLD